MVGGEPPPSAFNSSLNEPKLLQKNPIVAVLLAVPGAMGRGDGTPTPPHPYGGSRRGAVLRGPFPTCCLFVQTDADRCSRRLPPCTYDRALVNSRRRDAVCVTCCAVAVLMRFFIPPPPPPQTPPPGVVSLLVKYHFSKLLFKGEEPNARGCGRPAQLLCARIATCFCETVNTWILL